MTARREFLRGLIALAGAARLQAPFMARGRPAALAGSLLESLDTDVDEDAEAAWATEAHHRVAELDSGAVKTIP